MTDNATNQASTEIQDYGSHGLMHHSNQLSKHQDHVKVDYAT
jgi:hypothetical protein